MMAEPYPHWICADCGKKYGKPRDMVSTFHYSTCPVCKKKAYVTQPLDYRYPQIPGFLNP